MKALPLPEMIFRALMPLTDAEITTIAHNVAPYLREPAR